MLRMFSVVVASALIAVTTGCGSGDNRVQVTGTVTYADGTPVTGEVATLAFQPTGTGPDSGKPANGTIEPDGSFQLMTTRPGDGVAPGDYKVVLLVWKDYRSKTPAVPSQYTEAATTPLQAKVTADARHFDFSVDKK